MADNKQTEKKELTPLEHIAVDLKRFFSAGSGEAAVLTIERFFEEKVAQLAEDELPAWARPIVDLVISKIEDYATEKSKEGLESLNPDPTPTASSTVTASPSTEADKAPAKTVNIPDSFRAVFDGFTPAQKSAYLAAHA